MIIAWGITTLLRWSKLPLASSRMSLSLRQLQHHLRLSSLIQKWKILILTRKINTGGLAPPLYRDAGTGAPLIITDCVGHMILHQPWTLDYIKGASWIYGIGSLELLALLNWWVYLATSGDLLKPTPSVRRSHINVKWPKNLFSVDLY